MGAARFTAAAQARERMDETLGLERSRRVKETSELNAKWASEVGALRDQLHKERVAHAAQMDQLVMNHVVEVSTLRAQLSAARDEVNKLRSVNASQASELKSLEGVRGFIEAVRGANDAEQSK
jgi:hypothetical protein